ncbi:hypothetical protein OAT84_02810 [Gammaproteobacteria bacterium]|nr:hypothetical protein [Gammaproteobacteria bacterium]
MSNNNREKEKNIIEEVRRIQALLGITPDDKSPNHDRKPTHRSNKSSTKRPNQ